MDTGKTRDSLVNPGGNASAWHGAHIITYSLLDQCHEEGLITGVGDDIFRIAGVKLFLDGSAGGRTAYMKTPYEPTAEGQPDNYGLQCQTAETTEEIVMKAHKWGYQVTPHAIGDAAIERIRAFAAGGGHVVVLGDSSGTSKNPTPGARCECEARAFPRATPPWSSKFLPTPRPLSAPASTAAARRRQLARESART